MKIESFDGRRLRAALAELGADPSLVSAELAACLDRDGFVVIPGVLTPAALAQLRSHLDELAQREGAFAGGVMLPGVCTHPRGRLSDELVFRLLDVVMRAVDHVANKYVFRYRPRWKDALLSEVSRRRAEPLVEGRLHGWVRGLFHTAARQEHKVLRIENLVSKGMPFQRCFTDPLILSLVSRVLQVDLKLSSLNFRAANPGGGLQPMHVDWHEPVEADQHFACNTLWMLDDFTPENGATRVIPGSHRWASMPSLAHQGPAAEKLLTGTAGSVIVLNSHVWHGGTLNRTDRPRRVIQAYFVRRHCTPQLDQADFLYPEIKRALSDAAKTVLFLPPEDVEVEATTSTARSQSAG